MNFSFFLWVIDVFKKSIISYKMNYWPSNINTRTHTHTLIHRETKHKRQDIFHQIEKMEEKKFCNQIFFRFRLMIPGTKKNEMNEMNENCH